MSLRKRPSKRRIKAQMIARGYLRAVDRVRYELAVPDGWQYDMVREVWRPVVMRDWILAGATIEAKMPSYMTPSDA